VKVIDFSIITVVYNCVTTIEETILSVLRQSYKNYEYIIIDGASSDGSTEIIKKHEKDLSFFLSEKDGGLYDAMNKGMALASAKFCMFLNAGDVLYEETTLSKYAQTISDDECIYFATAVMTDRENIFRLRPPEKVEIADWLSKGNLPNHQSMLFPKSFYTNNKYNLDFKMASDDDFKRRALAERKAVFLPQWTILFELGGISKSSKSISRVVQRNREVRLLSQGSRKSRARYFRYVCKSLVLWLLTKVFGENYHLDLYFNKFQRIPKDDISKYNPQFKR